MSRYEQTLTWNSLEEFAAEAYANVDAGYFTHYLDDHFHGVSTWDEVKNLARDGWADRESEALAIAEQAIAQVERETEGAQFRAVWDVSGSTVDIGAFLAGEPENMIDNHVVAVPTNGRVVTIVSSTSASGAVSTDTIERRGHIVASLSIALTMLGFNVELWIDDSASGNYGGGKQKTCRMRVCVKSANDELDVARIMYAFSHPSVLRALGFAASHSFREDIKKSVGIGNGYGMPVNPKRDLPEGTIYMDCLRSSYDVPEAATALRGHLIDLGVIEP